MFSSFVSRVFFPRVHAQGPVLSLHLSGSPSHLRFFSTQPPEQAKSIFEFSETTIDGEEVPLEKYRGKVCLIVNVASRCGFTNSNYQQMATLYDKYHDRGEERDDGLFFFFVYFFLGFEILAFPSNQVGCFLVGVFFVDGSFCSLGDRNLVQTRISIGLLARSMVLVIHYFRRLVCFFVLFCF